MSRTSHPAGPHAHPRYGLDRCSAIPLAALALPAAAHRGPPPRHARARKQTHTLYNSRICSHFAICDPASLKSASPCPPGVARFLPVGIFNLQPAGPTPQHRNAAALVHTKVVGPGAGEAARRRGGAAASKTPKNMPPRSTRRPVRKCEHRTHTNTRTRWKHAKAMMAAYGLGFRVFKC